ncbi:MAG TPA: uroporphyrinogen decarboxylase family protein [Candidatus Limnocylindrales bacterium]
MHSIDRIRAVLAGKPVDRLPVQPMLMMFAAKHAGQLFVDYARDGRKLAEAQLKVAADYGIDCLLAGSDPAREVVDIAGPDSVLWTDSGPTIDEDHPALADKRRLASLETPDPLSGGRMTDQIKSIEIMREFAGPGASVVGWVEGPLALAQELRGLSNLMLDFQDDPGFVTDLLTFAAEVAVRNWEPQVEAGADTIGMGDAAASLIGPVLYEKFVLPAQMHVVTAIRGTRPGVIVRLHMCGRTDPLLPAMQRLPVDIFELDFPVDLVRAREVLGDDRTILGNVSTVGVMLSGTPEQVYEAAAACHRACGGHFIVGTGCEVSPDTPPDNLRAIVAYAREHGADPEAGPAAPIAGGSLASRSEPDL